MEIDELENFFIYANRVCDPIEFACRQKELTHAIAKFLIEKYKPKEPEEKEE